MRKLVNLIEKANDTMEEIEWYAEKAHHIRAEHKGLADVYIKIASMHIEIYDMLHGQMVEVIEEVKRKGTPPPPEMLAIWNYEHEKLVKEFAEAKFLVEDYKKSY
jgi:hypothetical protein